MGGGFESRHVGRVYGADGALRLRSHATIRTVHTTHAAALKTTTHPKTWCRKPQAATQYPMLLLGSRTAPSALYTRPTRRLSRPPPIQKLGAENHKLQLNIQCS